jgi:hypothetical protein
VLERLGLLSILPKCLTLSAFPVVEWLLIRWVGQVFLTTLIILEGQGIDVILGMNWMKMHQVLLDIIAHLVHLDSPIYGKISLQLPPIARLQASVYTIVAKSLDEIVMVSEYPDVFPDELLGMPPDRDIEFKIELQPGTTPVYKRTYPMV